MKKINYLLLFFLVISIILSMYLVSPIMISFINGNSIENLTFTGNQNITRNISISKYVNVTEAYLNLSSYTNNQIYDFIESYNNVSKKEATYGYFNQTNLTRSSPFFWMPELLDSEVTDLINSSTRFVRGNYYNVRYNFTKEFNITISYNVSAIETNTTQYHADSFGSRTYSDYYFFNNSNSQWELISSGISSHDDAGSGSCENTVHIINISANYVSNNIIKIRYNEYGNEASTQSSSVVANSDSCIGITVPQSDNNQLEFLEYKIKYIYGSYSANLSLSVNNSQIWNYSGEFVTINNKTNDFKDVLNSALNNGKCSCNGCSLLGTNCSIPFTFHSDTAGVLQYSDIQINYDSIPFVYLTSPENATYSSSNKTFTCNSTDEINLKNKTLYIWNSTGVIYNDTENRVISGLENSTTFNIINFSYSDTYSWNCLVYNNGNYSNWFSSNYTLFVDISNPIITLNYPSNNLWLSNGTNINLNCTAEGNNLDSVFLYGNFTGNFLLNQTKQGVVDGSTNSFLLNLSDNQYLWSCGANKTTSAIIVYSQYGNYTLGIDTIYPVGYNMTITTTAGSQTISFINNVTDINLNSCKYSIYNSTGSIDGLNNNISFTCNSLSSATTTLTPPSTFMLYNYALDKAGNTLTQNLSFSTSPTSGVTVTGGGGTTTIPELATNFSILNTNFDNTIDIKLAKDSVRPREKTIILLNRQKDAVSLELSCEPTNTESEINICDYVTLLNASIVVTANEDMPTETAFYLSTPKDSDYGDAYYFNIIAKTKEEKYSKLSVSSEVSLLSTFFYKYSYIPFQSVPDKDKSAYPTLLVSFIISLLLFFIFLAILRKFDLIFSGFMISLLLFAVSLIIFQFYVL